MGLNKRGIVTFLQIANLTDQEVADIEEDLDLKVVSIASVGDINHVNYILIIIN